MATTGTLGVAGEHDWLKVTLLAGQAYEFTVTGLSNYASLEVATAALLDKGLLAVQTVDTLGTQQPATATAWFTPDTAGTYYIDISDPGTVGGTYSVSAVTEPNDFPDNTTTSGVVTVGGAATTGTLGVAGEHDWLKVTLLAGQAYEFTVTGLSNYASLEVASSALLDKGLLAVQSVDTLGTQQPATATAWFTPDTAGTYYIDISDPGTVGGTYSVSAVTEPNDFPDNTTTSGVVTVGGAATTGTLGVAGEHDWLKVTLLAGQAYQFTVTGLSNYASLEVASSALLDKGLLAVQTVDTLGTQQPATATAWFTPDTAGTYYIDISDPGTVGGTYSVSAVTEPNDFPDNTTTSGVVTVGGAATTGTLGVAGEHDWLKVTLLAGQAYEFTVTGLSNYASLEVASSALLDKGLLAVQTVDTLGTQQPATATAWFTPDTAGTYYIDISDPGTVGGTYSVSAVSEPNDFPDNTTTTGVVTVGGAATTGTLGVAGEHDWLKVTLLAGQAYEFTVTGLSNYASLEVATAALLDKGLLAVQTVDTLGTQQSATATAWFTPDTAGTYYIDISDPGTVGGTYSVSAVTEPNDFPDNTTTTGVVTVGGAGIAPPTISGTAAAQLATDQTTVALFSQVTIADTNPGQSETVIITLSVAGNGTLSNLGGGSYDTVTGVYQLTGTAAAVTVTIDGLLFTAIPTPLQSDRGQTVTTGFTIQVTDTAGGTATDSATTVITHSARTGTQDYNDDGTSDVLYANTSGAVGLWTVQNGLEAAPSIVGNPGTTWTVTGTGDFNGDGTPDVLLRNTSGVFGEWLVKNGQVQTAKALENPGNSWTYLGTGDLDGNGIDDVIFRNTDGTIADWQMQNGAVAGVQVVGGITNNWIFAGVGDLTGDGTSDLLFLGTDGTVADWTIQNGTEAGARVLGNIGNSWSIIGIGDLNGNGQNDILFKSTTGDIAAWMMKNGAVVGVQDFGNPGPTWQVVGIGDYNANGVSDVLFRNTNGTMAEWLMQSQPLTTTAHVAQVSVMGSITSDWQVAPVHTAVTLPS